jgi:thiamine-phosphate pyrophosphorylase
MTNISNLSQAHKEGLERLIDANLNRLGEGIRVIEDVNRYIHNNRTLTPRLKSLRHKLQKAYSIDRLRYRDIQNDIQKKSIKTELVRSSLNDLIIANFSRTEESSRVLEESFKLIDIELSEIFKSVRYELYELESIYFEDNQEK